MRRAVMSAAGREHTHVRARPSTAHGSTDASESTLPGLAAIGTARFFKIRDDRFVAREITEREVPLHLLPHPLQGQVLGVNHGQVDAPCRTDPLLHVVTGLLLEDLDFVGVLVGRAVVLGALEFERDPGRVVAVELHLFAGCWG